MTPVAALGRLALAAGIVAAGYGGARGVGWLLGVDPFAAFRPKKSDALPDDVAMRMRDVEVVRYRDGKRVLSARVAHAEASKDRTTLKLRGVTDGVGVGEKGKIRFAAKRATMTTDVGRIEGSGGVRVAGDRFDVTAPAMTLDPTTNLVTVPQPLSGTVAGGSARARTVVYNTKTGAYKVGGAAWQGDVQKATEGQIAPDEEAPRGKWAIVSDESEYSPEGRSETHLKASATDGEILLKAPKIVRDRRTDVLTATGRVFYYSAKADLVADQVVVYRKEKRAVLTGNVVMLVKPKDETGGYQPKETPIPERPKADREAKPTLTKGPTEDEKKLDEEIRDGDTARRYPLIVGADRIEYWYRKGERRAVATGDPQARQELPKGRWRHVWTHQADYDGEREKLLAKSEPGKTDTRLKNSVGDDLVATQFILSTKEGDERWSGKGIQGDVVQDESEDDPRDKKPPPPPPGSKKGG